MTGRDDTEVEEAGDEFMRAMKTEKTMMLREMILKCKKSGRRETRLMAAVKGEMTVERRGEMILE